MVSLISMYIYLLLIGYIMRRFRNEILCLNSDTGVMSGAMIFVRKEFHISDVKTEVLAGILNLCALIGSLSAGRTSDYVGRRYTIVLHL